MKTFWMLFSFGLGMMGTSAAWCQDPQVLGWIETVRICGENLVFLAKLDTGARNSSLNASHIQRFERDGEKWVRFSVSDRNQKRATLEKRLVRMAKIKEDNGPVVERPAVQFGICLGNQYRLAEVNLTDRTGYNYQMLIGRSFMKGALIIDPSVQFTRKPSCPGACDQ